MDSQMKTGAIKGTQTDLTWTKSMPGPVSISTQERSRQTKSSPTSAQNIRVLLLGYPGHGKSSTGNSLLGKKTFKKSLNAKTRTTDFHSETSAFQTPGGRTVDIIDSPSLDEPNFFNLFERRNDDLCPDIIALVLWPGRFTESVRRVLFKIEWDHIKDNVFVILTNSETEKDLTEYLGEGESDRDVDFEHFIKTVGGRNNIYLLDNKYDEDLRQTQTWDILKRIDGIMDATGGREKYNIKEAKQSTQRIGGLVGWVWKQIAKLVK